MAASQHRWLRSQDLYFTEEAWRVLETTRTALLTFGADNQADDQTPDQETRYNVDFANQSLHLAMALAERGPIDDQLEVYMLLIRSDIAFAMGDDRLSTSLAQQVQRRLEKIENPQPPSFKTVVRDLGRLAQDGWQRRHANMTVAEQERAIATQRFLGVYPKFAVESAAPTPPQSPGQTTDSRP